MESLSLFLSASGRIAPKPFAFAALAVYTASFLSQVLISPPMSAIGGLYAFGAVQIALAWGWYALHARRLRDAGLPTGSAQAIAVLYALAIVLLMLLVEPVLGPDPSTAGVQERRSGFSDLWVVLLLIAALAAQPNFGFFDIFALGTLTLVLAPIVIAIGFSIWAWTRPPVATAPETPQQQVS